MSCKPHPNDGLWHTKSSGDFVNHSEPPIPTVRSPLLGFGAHWGPQPPSKNTKLKYTSEWRRDPEAHVFNCSVI